MIRRTNVAVLAIALGAGLLLAGCSGGGSSGKAATASTTTATPTTLGTLGPSAGDKVAFCNDNLALNTAAGAAKSLADVVKVFKAQVATIDDFGKQAPPAIQADAAKLVAAAHQVISSNSTKPFANAATVAAGKRVDTYCGANVSTTVTT